VSIELPKLLLPTIYVGGIPIFSLKRERSPCYSRSDEGTTKKNVAH
jgi:hypothetical protein